MRQLFDVVNQAIEIPLRVHLGLRSEREAVEVFVMPQVGEYGPDNGDAPAVELSPSVAVDRALHDLGVAKRRCLVLVEKDHLPDLGPPGVAQARADVEISSW